MITQLVYDNDTIENEVDWCYTITIDSQVIAQYDNDRLTSDITICDK